MLCADYNEWSDVDKAAQLKCYLTGIGAQMLWDGEVSNHMSYNKLLSKLKSRFGSGYQHERFAVEF